jgi:protein O-mannosyl-transferase
MQELDVKEFARRLKMTMMESDGRFIFFLGSGCSVSSGIPAAAGLVKNWLPRLKKIRTGSEDRLVDWLKAEYPDYQEENAASFYGPVIEALFFTPEERQREIERLTEGKDPGFGYAVLAQIMSHPTFITRCNIVLTTNFDDLVADALYLYTFKKPLVISHESLVGFVRITRTIPVVIKLHGDARLTPKNTELETQQLTEAVKKVLKNLLHETGLIFAGYGGNDQSILNILSELPAGALPWGVYWVNNRSPESGLGTWLDKVGAKWVRHLDFDELMLLIRDEFGLAHPDLKRFEKLRDTYQETFKKLTEKIARTPESEEKRVIEAAAAKAAKDFDSWFSVELEASKFKTSEPERAKAIYEEGLKQFPGQPGLLGNYANFLHEVHRDYEAAEQYYQHALEADPQQADNLGNYANFFKTIRQDYEAAEDYYNRALEANPQHANNLGNYALFLQTIRKDYEAAEDYYKRSLEANPQHDNNLGNYANFLTTIRKDYEAAEDYYNRALEANPQHANNLGNYALFLQIVRKDYEAVEDYFKKALSANPAHAVHLDNYANFLKNICQDYEAAEGSYKRALEADPQNANTLGNYAGFLLGKGEAEGFTVLEKALEKTDNDTLVLECLFYRYAHDANPQARQESLTRIKELIRSGVRSPGWNLEANVTRAVQDGHPEPQFLEILAKVIVDEMSEEKLDKFPVWKSPSG